MAWLRQSTKRNAIIAAVIGATIGVIYLIVDAL